MEIREIKDIPEGRKLAQLAEECAEGCQAALKLIRAYDGEPQLSGIECRVKLLEELADIMVCANAFMTDLDNQIYTQYYYEKKQRWEDRLNGRSKS